MFLSRTAPRITGKVLVAEAGRTLALVRAVGGQRGIRVASRSAFRLRQAASGLGFVRNHNPGFDGSVIKDVLRDLLGSPWQVSVRRPASRSYGIEYEFLEQADFHQPN